MDRGQIASGETLAEVMALSTRAGEPNFSSNAGVFDVFGCSGLPLQQPERCPEVGIWEDWKIVAGNRMLPDTGLLETEGSARRSCPKSSSPLAMQIPESTRSPEGCLGCPKIDVIGRNRVGCTVGKRVFGRSTEAERHTARTQFSGSAALVSQ